MSNRHLMFSHQVLDCALVAAPLSIMGGTGGRRSEARAVGAAAGGRKLKSLVVEDGELRGWKWR